MLCYIAIIAITAKNSNCGSRVGSPPPAPPFCQNSLAATEKPALGLGDTRKIKLINYKSLCTYIRKDANKTRNKGGGVRGG